MIKKGAERRKESKGGYCGRGKVKERNEASSVCLSSLLLFRVIQRPMLAQLAQHVRRDWNDGFAANVLQSNRGKRVSACKSGPSQQGCKERNAPSHCPVEPLAAVAEPAVGAPECLGTVSARICARAAAKVSFGSQTKEQPSELQILPSRRECPLSRLYWAPLRRRRQNQTGQTCYC